MNEFYFERLKIQGAALITSQYSVDDRGSFTKYYEKSIFKSSGIDISSGESFVSVSKKNVIRGLHLQLNHPQIKLVSTFYGEIYDVLVDLRLHSPTYKQWYGVKLSAESHQSLLVPRGCAHGFASISEYCVVNYFCDGAYDKETDGGIRFNDPAIGVQWPISMDDAIINNRDMQLRYLSEYSQSELSMLNTLL